MRVRRELCPIALNSVPVLCMTQGQNSDLWRTDYSVPAPPLPDVAIWPTARCTWCESTNESPEKKRPHMGRF
jgi:hypothetical protein